MCTEMSLPSLHTSKKIPPELDVMCKEEHVKLGRDGALSSPAKDRSTECSSAANAASACDRFDEPEQKGCPKQAAENTHDDVAYDT